MVIRNAQIVTENKIFNGYIEFDKNKIVNVKSGNTNKKGYDAKRLFLLPAFIDSHTHGGYGCDFNMLINVEKNKTQLLNYFKNINYEGVGSVLMTTISCNKNDLNKIANNYLQMKTHDREDVVKGWYVEGPYISKEYKGAHNEKFVVPLDVKELNKINKLLPDVTKILAVAPEFKNNIKKYDAINKKYFLATGHSGANYQQAIQAFSKKATRIIHLYNAMPNFDKRHPTLLNAIFNQNNLACELICDKAHVSAETILNTYKILGTNQLMIISDSLLTKGLKNGIYNVWGMKVKKVNALDYLINTNKIAGGNLPFHLQVKNFGQITKCSMIDILKVSSLNAAKSIKQEKHFGNLIKGAQSSFVLLNKNYELKGVFINGVKI